MTIAGNHSLPLIGVSSCLLGNLVRYDGGHKLQPQLTELQARFQLVAFCPEVVAGLGVPRPPMQLVETDTGIRAKGVADPGQDMTDVLQGCVSELAELDKLAGYIFKARSPSCGVRAVPVLNLAGEIETNGQGIFVTTLLQRRPDLPLIEEDALADSKQLDDFLARVEAFHLAIINKK